MITRLQSDLQTFSARKMFILISSLMTWINTKPLDPDDEEPSFSEEEYVRRRPHVNFKGQHEVEKAVIKARKLNRAKLITYVVGTGLTYGVGQGIFDYLFKAVWHNAEALLCFGKGLNVIPTIHVQDLASVIQNILDSRPKVKYIVAMDDSQNSLKEITKAVSTTFGTGKVRYLQTEECSTYSKDLKSTELDKLMSNLKITASFVKENFNIRWKAETGMVDSMEAVVKEYKEVRGFMPMRILINGPPAAGKSTIARQLCQAFHIPHLKIKSVIEDSISMMEKYLAKKEMQKSVSEDETEEDGEEEDEEDYENAAEYEELLETIRLNKEENDGRLDDTCLTQVFKQVLMSKQCQNHGFLLDGYPKTATQAKLLFNSSGDGADDPRGPPTYDETLTPEVVINPDADDSFLIYRISNLTASEIVEKHDNVQDLLRRLAVYRKTESNYDTSVLNFFDELEILPVIIDVSKDQSPRMKDTLEKLKTVIIGERKYGELGLAPELLHEIHQLDMEEKLKKEAAQNVERDRLEEEEALLKLQRQQSWSKYYEEVKEEEQEMLDTHALPLRNYLMKHVMPTMISALMAGCTARDGDPIDFISEYLLNTENYEQ